MPYKIVRLFNTGEKRVIRNGLTLIQAQSHCNNLECNSRTAESQAAKYLTATKGHWADTFDSEGSSYNDCLHCSCELGGEG